MRRCCLIVLAIVALVTTSGAASVWANPIADAQQSADELLATDRAFASSARKSDAIGSLSAMFSDDVIMPVRGKGFATGKAAVVEAFKSNPEPSGARVEWTPLGVGVSADGKQGFTFGFMTEHHDDNKQTLFKYLAYWRRDKAGWRVIAYNRGRRAQGPTDNAPRAALLPDFAAVARTVNKSNPAKSLARAERAFSDRAQLVGLTTAFAEFGTADSMNLGGGGNAGFVFGADAIAKLVGGGEPEHGSSVSWAADERVVVADSGDLGLSVGHIRFNQRAEDGSERPPIPFFTVWRRPSADLPWRYVAE